MYAAVETGKKAIALMRDGLTRKEVAERFGLKERTLTSYITYARHPDTYENTLQRISRARDEIKKDVPGSAAWWKARGF